MLDTMIQFIVAEQAESTNQVKRPCPVCGQETYTAGGMHFSAGEVWDDLHDVCPCCGWEE